ncbi:hypothetical protein LOZ53_003734 [Ophidiomyces ophidiicola]|nr:hypothetical protein LOZ55_005412 [Ophidiomyces ophidiicola]KAI1977634.1 hypothetical protein LOZ54_006452 [Ophidiomyces ophidiicola]KAI1986746.1 hypothetical protein LOZ51_005906 [Ophidiomyces ophidiicola]KAI1989057.1 hypothetical protein LOZ53_003734 [Ophidiomyces ophidiicola]
MRFTTVLTLFLASSVAAQYSTHWLSAWKVFENEVAKYMKQWGRTTDQVLGSSTPLPLTEMNESLKGLDNSWRKFAQILDAANRKDSTPADNAQMCNHMPREFRLMADNGDKMRRLGIEVKSKGASKYQGIEVTRTNLQGVQGSFETVSRSLSRQGLDSCQGDYMAARNDAKAKLDAAVRAWRA